MSETPVTPDKVVATVDQDAHPDLPIALVLDGEPSLLLNRSGALHIIRQLHAAVATLDWQRADFFYGSDWRGVKAHIIADDPDDPDRVGARTRTALCGRKPYVSEFATGWSLTPLVPGLNIHSDVCQRCLRLWRNTPEQ